MSPATTTLLRTPLYHEHVRLGGKLVPFAGYEMPLRYSGDVAEHQAVRTQAGLFDVSHMGEFLVRGPGALAFLQQLVTNDVSKVPVGKAQYNALPNRDAGILDDLIVYHLEPELYMLVVNASNIQKDWDWVMQFKTPDVALENISDQTALIALSGPNAPAILRKLTETPFEDLPFYAQMKGTVAGLDNVLIATTGYTGERTFELFCRNEQAVGLWNSLLEAGSTLGLTPAGLGARDSLRLEMGYLLYGNDMTEENHPLEAGLGWVTKLDKGDFNGRSVIEGVKAEGGPAQRLIAFEAQEPRAIPRKGYTLLADGLPVGTVTSGVFSPTLQKGIGMAYVNTDVLKANIPLALDLRGKASPVSVVKAPFVKDTSLSRWMGK
jgi:aminomethyltransferase